MYNLVASIAKGEGEESVIGFCVFVCICKTLEREKKLATYVDPEFIFVILKLITLLGQTRETCSITTLYFANS